MQITSILVVLHYPNSSNLLKAASELAHKSGALLKAYYLENAEWFEASKISFSTQVSGYKGEILPLTEKQITRESQALSERLKKMFVTYGEQYQIKYTYRFVRGTSIDELESAAAETDLLIIKRNTRTIGKERLISPMVRNLVLNTQTPLVIWNERSELWPKSIVALSNNLDECGKIVSWSLKLADMMRQSVHFFWPDSVDTGSREFADTMAAEGLQSYLDLIRAQSEVYPPTAFEYLKYHQKALVVLRRTEDHSIVINLIENLPNTVLLI